MEIVTYAVALGMWSFIGWLWYDHYAFWKKAGIYKHWWELFWGGKHPWLR